MKKPASKIYRTTNWSSYNQTLIKRGNISIWFDRQTKWHAQPQAKHRRNQTYSDRAIQCWTTRARSVAGYSAGIYASLFAVGNACATIVLARWDNALQKDVLDEVLNKPKSS